jgi:hypothetical protein
MLNQQIFARLAEILNLNRLSVSSRAARRATRTRDDDDQHDHADDHQRLSEHEYDPRRVS